MIEIICNACGIIFGMPGGYDSARRNDGKTFYCPNGHSLSYRESEVDRQRRRADRLAQENARLAQEAADAQAEAIAAEKKVARLKKRAAAGACPCCKRTFSNMAEHMKRRHPELIAETGGSVVKLPKRSAA